MTDDERRRLYGRPSPGELAPVFSMAPVATDPTELADPTDPTPTPPPTAEPLVEPGPPRRPRRALLLAAAAGAAVALLAAAILLMGPTAPPSLAVFDREPTAREREAEESLNRGGAYLFPGSEAQARLILDVVGAETTARELWALRADASEQVGFPYVIVCIATDPLERAGGPLSCMEEHDVARRGFIPLDQPRPTVVVDGEQLVVEWGPTGDARLIARPEPPTRADR